MLMSLRMQAVKATVAAVALVLFVSACAPASGKITDRRFIPRHEVNETVGDRVTKKTVPDTWELHLVKGDQKGWLKVNKTTYDVCQTGEQYPDCVRGK
jgi:hypothetical protein